VSLWLPPGPDAGWGGRNSARTARCCGSPWQPTGMRSSRPRGGCSNRPGPPGRWDCCPPRPGSASPAGRRPATWPVRNWLSSFRPDTSRKEDSDGVL